MITQSEDLLIFLTVIEQKSFSKAAQQLSIQPAKVSRTISKLEEQLRTTLINRTTRSLHLTEEGKQFLSIIKKGFSYIEFAEQTLLQKDRKPFGRLRVDAASPFIFHQIIPLIEEFKVLYPDIQLELTSHEDYTDLLKNETDIAIRIGKLNNSSMVAANLGKSRLLIVASPQYIRKNGVPKSPNDLNKHTLIGFTNPTSLNDWNLKNQNKITPQILTNNGEIIRQLTLANHRISCLSSFMVNNDIAEGRLVPLLTKSQRKSSPRENVNAVFYKTSAVSTRVRAFIDFIKPRLDL